MNQIVIIDDMKQHIDRILPFLNDLPHDAIKTYQSVSEFTKDRDTLSDYSIFILDICIDQDDGIELAKNILQLFPSSQIIFISSFLEKAIDVYEVEHCYFIYKPKLEAYLPDALNKASHKIEEAKQCLIIQLKDKVKVIRFADIIYIERNKRNTFIHTVSETIRYAENLNLLDEQLPDYFIRCHNSFIFNIKFALEIKRTSVLLENRITIPVSRKYQLNVKAATHHYLMKEL